MSWSSPLPPMQPRDDRPDGERGFVSLRDHLAMAALTGLLLWKRDDDAACTSSDFARWAYGIADAMLAAREVK